MNRSNRPLVAVVIAVLALGLVLGACGNGGSAGGDRPMDSMPEDMSGNGMAHEHGASTPVVNGARRIEVNATSFAFNPDEIAVNAGEDVAIVLTSKDLLHDFTIDEADVHVAAEKDQTAEGGLRAETPGKYTFYCTVPGHREAGMEGTLIVKAA